MVFTDLREFIEKAQSIGECEIVEGADWDGEIGAITDLQTQRQSSPLLVFDRVKGYPVGYRVLTNIGSSPRRVNMTFGLPAKAKGMEQVRAWRERMHQGVKRIPPIEVSSGPVMENVLTGNEVDLFKFPVPRWHEGDGGRYIGTGTAVVTRDPDDGWVNLGTYRVEVHEKDMVTVALASGHHGNLIANKYWSKGKGCPMAICCGEPPLVYAAATFEIPWKYSEYEWAGGWQKKPLAVVRGKATGLPIPAHAEIVLEGELTPPQVETHAEGPFGEWHGYYAAGVKGVRNLSVMHVKNVYHRNDPIILGAPPSVAPRGWTLGRHTQMCAELWDDLEKNLPGIQGVWFIEEAALHCIAVVSIKQMYGGHAKQVAMATAGSLIGGYACTYVIIVDEDIDPSNLAEVWWALGTRAEPSKIEVITDCWGSPSNPRLTPEQRMIDDKTHSMGFIMACRPYSWIHDYPPSIKTSPELAKKVQEKYPKLFR